MFRPFLARQDSLRHRVQPQGVAAFFCFQQGGGEHLPPGADERVAADQLGAEPGHKGALVDGVQPQGDLGQFHRGGVEVHAVDVVVGEEHLHLLQFPGIVLVGQGLAGFLLFAVQVGAGQLVDRLVEEGGAAHGRLAHGEREDLVRGLVLEQFLEGVFHQALGEHLRGVVGG